MKGKTIMNTTLFDLVVFYFIVGCMANETVHYACGDGNGCKGSLDDWICVCNAPGWRAVDGNQMSCHESK